MIRFRNQPLALAFTCPRCGMTSYHPVDIAEGYCGNCHDWTRTSAPPRRIGCWGLEIGTTASAVASAVWFAALIGACAYFIWSLTAF